MWVGKVTTDIGVPQVVPRGTVEVMENHSRHIRTWCDQHRLDTVGICTRGTTGTLVTAVTRGTEAGTEACFSME
jgi:hypothetical protein